MHYDTFDLIKADPAEFVKKAEAKGYKAVAGTAGRSLQGHVTGRCPTSTRQQQEQQSGAAAVIVYQPFGDPLRFNSHWHALILEGGFDTSVSV